MLWISRPSEPVAWYVAVEVQVAAVLLRVGSLPAELEIDDGEYIGVKGSDARNSTDSLCGTCCWLCSASRSVRLMYDPVGSEYFGTKVASG